jgi:hypothetical protein
MVEVTPRGYGWRRSNNVESIKRRGSVRTQAIHAMTGGEPVVYALRLLDGIIKIGCTRDLPKRRTAYDRSEILAFRFGDEQDEQAIHATLIPHRARGREYYHPTPEVLAVVNDMRSDFNLPPL